MGVGSVPGITTGRNLPASANGLRSVSLWPLKGSGHTGIKPSSQDSVPNSASLGLEKKILAHENEKSQVAKQGAYRALLSLGSSFLPWGALQTCG